MANNNIDPNVGSRNWTSFVLVENGKPVRRSDAPLYFKTDTGQRPTDEWLAQDGYFGFIDTLPPTDYNKYEQKVIKLSIDKLIVDPGSDTVTQRWSIVDMTSAEKLEALEVLKNDINDLRDGKIRAGCSVKLNGISTPLYISGSEDNIRNISNLAQLAMFQVSNGSTTTIAFRDDKNIIYNLTPAQVIEMWQKSMQYITSLYQASWTLKDSSPVPQDFTDQKYWPSNEVK